MRFYIIDAFADQLFGGNPAGVVILPEGSSFPSPETMVKAAAEFRYSETAFILKKSDGKLNIRYFTPTDEVDLCGHATIASFCALLEAGLVKDNNTYGIETLAGNLNVKVENGLVMMDMASPESLGAIEDKDDLKELYGVMGLSLDEGEVILDNEWTLLPEKISTGLPDIILPVANRDLLDRIKPDFKSLSELSEKYGVVGVHAFSLGEGLLGDSCPEPNQVTAYCRNFAPLYGIDEEAATGTANGALTYYLYKNTLIDDGAECLFIQGEAMKRPSKVLSCIALEDEGVNVKVGGRGVIVAQGRVNL